eukprot:CAMPEP_0172182066 /NCGR_PEP_ID=MMETSP1050-20130122/18184_1 /TAXON_ID=233186 /ORGANISM="Cryptomonas curvata, Strain CCAP979/52" /LENGTH=88 /DNA_ID=CAMNT_0012855453 /DNA_START=102 /DNA_END=365 /DNA_ORIENTATION=+
MPSTLITDTARRLEHLVQIPGTTQRSNEATKQLGFFANMIPSVTALLETLELQESAKHKGHFALFNCLVPGHTKYKGVQRVYCNPFPS